MKKKIVKILLGIVVIIAAIVGIYLAYAFITYYRIEDNKVLDINGQENTTLEEINTNELYKIVSANVGFGAYSDDYSFFMDGGTESWAFSKEACLANIEGSVNTIANEKADLVLMQEIDIDSTRSYHINQMDQAISILNKNNITDINYTFAQNYDSPFLFYPLTQPHGKCVAGLLTISKFTINDSIRRSLPVETGFSKMIDLDRCYSKNYIATDNGKSLVLYNAHLSAYTTDPSTAENQVRMLNEDILNEYNAGNYIIVGGDMNKDLLGDSSLVFHKGSNDANWAGPFPVELLDSHFSVIAPINENDPVPSCRNADAPYTDDTFVLTIDGFIVSDNVEVEYSDVIDTQFKYSDHNPVFMDFKLK